MLKNLRKKRGLTQKDLAKLVGVSPTAIVQWEKGQTTPVAAHLGALSRALDVDVNVLIAEIGAINSEQSPQKDDIIGTLNTIRIMNGELPALTFSAAAVVLSNLQIPMEPAFYDGFEWVNVGVRPSFVGPGDKLAVVMEGESMAAPSFPSLPAGCIAVADTKGVPGSGDIVIAHRRDPDEATIKRLIVDGPNRYLMPLNVAYRPIILDDNDWQIGARVQRIIMDLK